MPDYQPQEFLFQRIKELLPPDASLVDKVADILHVSNDSAYRRIRGETPVVLDEARELCAYFKISLDQILHVQGGTTLFQNVRINLKGYSFEKYLSDLIRQIQYIGSFIHKDVIYLTKDMPLAPNFYFKPLVAFKYFFWMKTIIQHPDFQSKKFTIDCLPPEVEKLAHDFLIAYNKVPTSEIWNTESINAAILQIEFYRDSGYFFSPEEVLAVYNALEDTLHHLKHQVEFGCKFLPGENPETKKPNFNFYYNRVNLGDNTVLVETDRIKTAFLNYDILNYMYTRDEEFCEAMSVDLHNLMKKSTLISQTSEKQRNIYFNIMLNKIKDRKKNL